MDVGGSTVSRLGFLGADEQVLHGIFTATFGEEGFFLLGPAPATAP